MLRAVRAAMACHRSAAALLVLALLAGSPGLSPAIAAVAEDGQEHEMVTALDEPDESLRIIAAFIFSAWMTTILVADLPLPVPPVAPHPGWRSEEPAPAPAPTEPAVRSDLQDAALWSAGAGPTTASFAP